MTDKNYKYQNVWQVIDQALAEEIITFWLAHKALPNREMAKKRVQQVAVVARNSQDEIVGITTAYEQFSEHLENYFFFVRAFVVESARRSSVASDIVNQLKANMEEAAEDGKLGRCIGLYMEVENKQLQALRNQAVWPATKFVYVGKNARGDHLRVYYFDGAKIS